MFELVEFFESAREFLTNILTRAFSDSKPLKYNEIKLIIDNTLDGKGITYHEFKKRQEILKNAKVIDDRSKKAIENFQSKHYHHYLHNLRRKRSLNIPYKRDYIPKNTPCDRRPGNLMSSPIYLTIHSTANLKSTAKNERAWLTNPQNKRTASYHLVVDQKEAIECIPLNESAWHAGDGNGTGNRKTIGLEICESGDRGKTLENAIALAAKLLRDRGWKISKLKRHNDWSSKICPRILINNSDRNKPHHTWEWFKKEVDKRLC